MSYGNTDLITWNNVEFSLVWFFGTYLKATAQQLPSSLFSIMSSKLYFWNYCNASNNWGKDFPTFNNVYFIACIIVQLSVSLYYFI